MEYVIGSLIVVILVMGIVIRNLLKQTEQLDDLVRETKIETIEKIQSTIQKMKSIDEKGVFEKDDEVGAAFSDLIKIINELYGKI